jgi:2-polyprenyl-3-methyl-5-hydroxy-6-metoxy-1,4-benzoquinol methylase
MNINELRDRAMAYHTSLQTLKHSIEAPWSWYPYHSMGNIELLDHLLPPGHRDISELAADQPIADIGGADGDVGFFLASEGFAVDLIDHGPTNMNGLSGARRLKEELNSSVEIFDIDLDAQFDLPRQRYGLVLFLGILYHIQNPFYVMKALAERTRWCAVSTKVAAVTVDRSVRFARVPIAYLVGPAETNNDPTNYWIFSEAGLCRLWARTGWEVVSYMSVGETAGDSDPSSEHRDQRVFALLRAAAQVREYTPPLPTTSGTGQS